MILNNYRLIFVALALIGILLLSAPTIALFVKLPPDQEFSEIYLLGPTHTLENLPSTVTAGVPYLIYLGVVNHLGSSNYYSCYVKIGNDTKLLPNTTQNKPSPLSALYEYKTFVDNGATWEAPLTFQFDTINLVNDTAEISGVNINGIDNPVNITSALNPDKTTFTFTFMVELWSFNDVTITSQFNNRFVSLLINITK